MSKVLLLPVETAQRLQIALPRPENWGLMKCPQCTRTCWAHADQQKLIIAGEAEAVCVLCEQGHVLSESYRRMLRGEGGKQMMTLEEARRKFPPMWTVYRTPSDMPGVAFASRVFFGETRTDDVMTADSLPEIRNKIRAAGGSACLARSLYDDPVIVETWV